MSLWEVHLKCRYPYPLTTISSSLPGLPINVWSLWHRALVQVPTSDPAKLERVARGITEPGGAIEDFVDGPEGRIFLARFTFPDSPGVYGLFEQARCWLTPPWYYLDGWAYFRTISFDAAGVKALFGALRERGPTELIRKSELPLSVLPSSVWIHGLLGNLTERQVTALSAAHRTGYYRFPRSVGTDEIAEEIGIARTTFSEHLRKAENRLIDSMMPYIRIYAPSLDPRSSGPGGRVLPAPRPSFPQETEGARDPPRETGPPPA